MPLTLEKLFSPTVPSSFEFMGETVHLAWAPSRYTGEMDDFAVRMSAEMTADKARVVELREAGETDEADTLARKIERDDAATARRFVTQLLVTWDVLDGEDPLPITEESLKRLPTFFVIATFNAMSEENTVDPQNAPDSADTFNGKVRPARSPRGTNSSGARKSSGSRRGR